MQYSIATIIILNIFPASMYAAIFLEQRLNFLALIFPPLLNTTVVSKII